MTKTEAFTVASFGAKVTSPKLRQIVGTAD
jgi:hypothetical protein